MASYVYPDDLVAKVVIRRTKPKKDFMPPELRKQFDKGARAIGQVASVGSNLDSLLKTLSGKRLGLPSKVKGTLNDPLSFPAGIVESVDRKLRPGAYRPPL